MIREQAIPFKNNTEDPNYDAEGYLRPHNLIRFSPPIETVSNEVAKSPRNGSTLSVKGILSSNEIYDDESGHNDEFNIYEKFNHGSEMNDKGQEQNSFRMQRLDKNAAPNFDEMEEETGIDVTICDQAELSETSKAGLIESNINRKSQEKKRISIISKKLSTVPQETGVYISAASISDQPRLPETSNKGVIRSLVRMFSRGCRLVSGCCCSLGFVLGGSLTLLLVVLVMNNLPLKHEKTQISESTEKPQSSESTEKPQSSESTEKPQSSESTEKPQSSESTEKPQSSESTEKPQSSESTEKPQISESTRKPQISESTEKPQISESSEKPQISESIEEISKHLPQNFSLDWSNSLKSYSYYNMNHLTYKVRLKMPIKKTKAKRPCLVVVKNQLWFSVYRKLLVYSRNGKLLKSYKLPRNLLVNGVETDSGDICFATDKGVAGFDSNAKFKFRISRGRIYDVAYDKGILYGLKGGKKGKKVLWFTYNGNKWVGMGIIRLQEHQNRSLIKYDEIEVRKNTMYALINKKLHLYNISNVSSNIRSYNSPTGSEIDDMNLLGVDPDGVSLLLDMKHQVLRLCTEDGEWSILSPIPLNCLQCTPMTAVVDPNDNGIWVVVRDKSFNSYKIILYKLIPEE